MSGCGKRRSIPARVTTNSSFIWWSTSIVRCAIVVEKHRRMTAAGCDVAVDASPGENRGEVLTSPGARSSDAHGQ